MSSLAAACRTLEDPAALVELPCPGVSLIEVQRVELGESIAFLAMGDFDADGRADAVVSQPSPRVWLGHPGPDGRGRLVPAAALWPEFQRPVVGDFDGDKRLDVALLSSSGGSFDFPIEGQVAIGRGDGGFARVLPFASEFPGRAVGAADLDGDGRTDLLTTDRSDARPLLARPGGALANAGRQAMRFAIRSVADLDGDGRGDLAGRDDDGRLAIARGRGDGAFDEPLLLDLAEPAAPARRLAFSTPILAADADGNGRRDLIGTTEDGAIVAWLAQPAGGYTSARHSPGVLRAGLGIYEQAAAVDLDGDGRADVVASTDLQTGEGALRVACGRGDGTFEGPRVFGSADAAPDGLGGATGFEVGDVDGDGRTDVVLLEFVPTAPCSERGCVGRYRLRVFRNEPGAR